ncbi:MAG TPA: GWxTD domain-containing protein [Gemmatimonadaceae bacterium]|nr:GWxTD domain-containing protein [Gemmatimonadaceae bacterium]
MSMHPSRLLLFGTALTIACSPPRVGAERTPRPLPAVGGTPADVSELYRQIGLMAAPNPLAFVGKIAAFASSSPDTSIALVSISIPNRALTFAREGDRYRAPYDVRLALMQGTVEAASMNVTQIVRVGSFREINRTDESIIFQHFFRLRPGTYTLSAAVRDVGGSRTATQQISVTIPAFGTGRLSVPLLVYEAAGRTTLDTIPRILASPRSSAVFGRDSTVAIYVEAYGPPGARLPLDYVVRNSQGTQVWRDSANLARSGSLFNGILTVPISMVGIGVAHVSFIRRDTRDSVRTPLFVSFGEDIPLMSFEEMVGYLRYFTTPSRLRALREAPAERRATMWAEFLRVTDPIPETATNEDMQAYFGRIHQANVQFRSDHNPGWLSDRGMVFVSLGEPEQIFERNVNQTFSPTQATTNTRVQIWQYREYNSSLVFYEEGGGRWKLTRPSESEFISLNARRQVR